MSGHSKWAQIKRQKAVTDGKKGKVFTKFSRAITIAARTGGPEPDMNPALRLAIDRALAVNMPKENIERAIKKATAAQGAGAMSATLEAYGPGGVALLLEVMTDNRNRTIAELRHLLDSHGGSLGATGSVAWQFEHVGQIVLDLKNNTEENELKIIDAGASDVQEHDDGLYVITSPENLKAVEEKLHQAGLKVLSAELTYLAKQKIEIPDEQAASLAEVLSQLEEHVDVVTIVSNAA